MTEPTHLSAEEFQPDADEELAQNILDDLFVVSGYEHTGDSITTTISRLKELSVISIKAGRSASMQEHSEGKQEPEPPIPKWIDAAATDIRYHIENVGALISEETIRCLIFDRFCPKHEWEPDFSEEEPALDSKICGVCGREHKQ